MPLRRGRRRKPPRRERLRRRPAARHTDVEDGVHRARASGNGPQLLARHGQNDSVIAVAQGTEPGAVIDAAEILMRCGRAEEAASLLRRASAGPATSWLWRVLSGAEMLCGRLDGALDAAERARGAEPDNAEFALHHGHLLWRRGDMS